MKFRLPRLCVLGVPGTAPFSEELSDPFSTMLPASASGGGRLGGRSCSRFRRDGELLGVLRPECGVVLGAGRENGVLWKTLAGVWVRTTSAGPSSSLLILIYPPTHGAVSANTCSPTPQLQSPHSTSEQGSSQQVPWSLHV